MKGNAQQSIIHLAHLFFKFFHDGFGSVQVDSIVDSILEL